MKKDNGRWANIIKIVAEQLEILRGQGIAPTLRTMHYRLVSMQVIGNTKNEYTELSKQTARAREDGRLKINCFVDQGREVYDNQYQDDSELEEPEEYIDRAISTLEELDDDYSEIRIPRWYNQKHYLEIWIEKYALVSTFIQLARGDVPVRIVPNKGYSSLTFMYDNARRLKRIAADEGKEIHIRYFGDFDPSGSDMDRDIEERLSRYGVPGVDFERVAVKIEHVQRYNLPPMPTDAESVKKYNNDPRKDTFESEHGGSYAVELDALTVYAPDDLRQMVQDCIEEFYDQDIYDEEVRTRSTPEFKKEIRQMVHDKTQAFLNDYDVDDVGDDNGDEDIDDDDAGGDDTGTGADAGSDSDSSISTKDDDDNSSDGSNKNKDNNNSSSIDDEERARLTEKFNNMDPKPEVYDIENVGPTMARKFKEVGFHTALDVALADAANLSSRDVLYCSRDIALSFINAARRLINGS
jgi:hypothetical protein